MILPTAQGRRIAPHQVVPVDGAAAEPAPDAADDDGLVVAFYDEHRAGGTAGPENLGVEQEQLAGVHQKVRCSRYNCRSITSVGMTKFVGLARWVACVGCCGPVGSFSIIPEDI